MAVRFNLKTASVEGSASGLTGDTILFGADSIDASAPENYKLSAILAYIEQSFGITGIAPMGAEYIVGTANPYLTAERVVTSTATGEWDLSTAGQAKVSVPNAAITDAKLRSSAALSVIGRAVNSAGSPADIAAGANDRLLTRIADALAFTQLTAGMVPNDLITDGMLRNSAALSVVGRSANSVGDPADIAATAASDAVLRESGGVLGFGQVNTAGISDLAITLAKWASGILDTDTALAADSDTRVPSQRAVKAYADAITAALSAHIGDAADAHDASAISVTDVGGFFAATDVEAALAELAEDVAALDAAVVLKGTWDASAGTFPGAGAAQAGWSYIVSIGGTVDGVVFTANDRIVAIADNASTGTYAANWHKLDYTDQVLSVAGKTGAVTLAAADITDASANGQAILTAANYSAILALLGLDNSTTIGRLARFTGTGGQQGETGISEDGAGNLSDIVNASLGGYLDFAEIATPSNPAANRLRLYPVDDAGITKMAILDSDGLETILGEGGGGGGGGIPFATEIFGLTLSNNATDATNDIDFAAGRCVSDDGTADIIATVGLTKRLDATWAAGDDAGGRFSSTAIANTTYFCFVITNGVTTDFGFSPNIDPSSDDNYPSGYDFRRVGCILREAGVIAGFRQIGSRFVRTGMPTDRNVATDTGGAIQVTLSVPVGLKVRPICCFTSFAGASGNIQIFIGHGDQGSAPYLIIQPAVASQNAKYTLDGFIETDTSARIYYDLNIVAGASSAATIVTFGWHDDRQPTAVSAAASITTPRLPAGYLFGLELANNATDATNDIDFAFGECRDSADALDILATASMTKRLDATWAAGQDNGGRFSSTAIADTTYHCFVISDGTTTDFGFSPNVDPSADDTFPAGYSFRRIGSIMRVSAAIVPFKQRGNEFIRDVQITDINETSTGTSAVTRTMSVPLGIQVNALINVRLSDATPAAGHSCLVTSLEQPDTAPDTSGLLTVRIPQAGATVPQIASARILVRTNTSGQVRSRNEASAADIALVMATVGWIDERDAGVVSTSFRAPVVGFSAHKNGTDQTGIADSTFTLVTFGTEVYDVGGHFASNGWTPPAGIVNLTASIRLTGTFVAGATTAVAIYKNGVALSQHNHHSGVANAAIINITVMDLADGDDVYTVMTFCDVTSGTATLDGSAVHTRFSGTWLGPT